MVKTHGGRAFRPRCTVPPLPLPPAPAQLPLPPSCPQLLPPPPRLQPLLLLPLTAVLLWVPPLQPLPRGDTTLGLAPLHSLCHILGHPGGPHRLRGPGPRAQGSPPAPGFRNHSRHPHQGLVGAPPLDLSPASIIRRPLFHYNPIPENVDYSEKDLHDEVYYDLQSFSADQELRDSMLLVHRYSLEPFMTPRQFFYPRVVIKFYHTMKSRRESTPTALNFSIDGRVGILRALDIAAIFNLSVVLANSTAYRQWPHPLPREMVRLLSGTTTTGRFFLGGISRRVCFL